MITTSGPIWDRWNSGLYVGNTGRSHCRVTVEVGWQLHEALPYAVPIAKNPVRYFQRLDGQTETEIPNIKSVDMQESSDTDANTCTIIIYNQKLSPAAPLELGNPGYFSFSRGASVDGNIRWGHEPNEWADVLVPNALLRTYEGYGGFNDDGSPKSITACLAEGTLSPTGAWLVDTVVIDTAGTITLSCRDPRKLLVDEIIYPPFVRLAEDGGVYPLHYQRFYSREIDYPAIDYGVEIDGARLITGIESDKTSNGYWLVGDDGGVFTYGDNNFFGSKGGEFVHTLVGIAVTQTGYGYWLADKNGVVYAFGDANASLTGHAPAVGQTMIAIETPQPVFGIVSDGYYLCDTAGHVYAIGGLTYHGGSPTLTHPIVGMAVQPTGGGYWLVDDHGEVFAYGDAAYFGNAPYAGSLFTSIATTPSGLGYYLVDKVGHVYAFGDAVYRGGTDHTVLNDPISDLDAAPDGSGYWLVAEDGGVFSFGTNFYGSLPGGSSADFPTGDGNYLDYADIVKDILRWAGYTLFDVTGATANVFGAIENTNAYSDSLLGDDIFDKLSPMDVINKLKEIVGYIVWSDIDGGIHFESPNWWGPGNFLYNGTHTPVIPEIDERRQMVSYGLQTDDKSLRSVVVISSDQPTNDGSTISGTVTSTIVPSTTAGLKGIPKPVLLWNSLFVNEAEQQLMAQLLAVQIWFTLRQGSVTCAANPLIQVNDQVQIWERQTDETYIHYVSSKATHHDLDTGEYTMTLTTHWLGSVAEWALDEAFGITHLRQTVARYTPVVSATIPGDSTGGTTGGPGGTPLTLPLPISGLSRTLVTEIAGYEVTLHWTASTSSGFRVYMGGTAPGNRIANVATPNATSWTDPSLRAPGSWTYYVSVYNGVGESDKRAITVVIDDPSITPVGASAIGFSAEALAPGSGWQDGTNVETAQTETGVTATYVTIWAAHSLSAYQSMVNNFVTLSASGQKLEGKVPVFSIAIGMDDSGNAAVNSGAKDADITAFANTLAASGITNAILRMGWEFPISSFAWGVNAGTSSQIAFRDAYSRQADIIRAIVPSAKFEICGIAAEFDYSAAIAWDEADYVGLDLYDDWQGAGSAKLSTDPYASYVDPAAAWTGLWYHNSNPADPVPGSPAWLWNLTIANSKPFAMSEWGLMARVALPSAGGGDNGVFIDKVADLVGSGHVHHAVYFTAGATFDGQNQDHIIYDGHFPVALARFTARFG